MKPHRFDPISFIAGVVIAAFGLLFLVPQTPFDAVDMVTGVGRWFWPVLLLLIGIAVLIPVFQGKDDEVEEPEV